jgi:hypothetical protein
MKAEQDGRSAAAFIHLSKIFTQQDPAATRSQSFLTPALFSV